MMAKAMEDASKKFIHELKVVEASNTWNITGKSAAHVIAIFKSMVNNRKGQYGYCSTKKFEFKIGNSPTIKFELETNPSYDQPGNGRITRNGKALTYENLAKKLSQQYDNDTEGFAKDVKRVFKDNLKLLKGANEILQDVYILLLFEIGRRLVDDKNVSQLTPRKQAYDSLPISAAITIIVKLFEMKRCSFNDVFYPNGKFNCLSGEPETRRDAINLLRTQLEKLNLEDLKELFHVEEDEKSPEDTTSKDNESSEGAVSVVTGGVKALSLSEGSQKESKKASNKD